MNQSDTLTTVIHKDNGHGFPHSNGMHNGSRAAGRPVADPIRPRQANNTTCTTFTYAFLEKLLKWVSYFAERRCVCSRSSLRGWINRPFWRSNHSSFALSHAEVYTRIPHAGTKLTFPLVLRMRLERTRGLLVLVEVLVCRGLVFRRREVWVSSMSAAVH